MLSKRRCSSIGLTYLYLGRARVWTAYQCGTHSGVSHLGTRRYCDVESTSMTLIQRRNNVVCPVSHDVCVIKHGTQKTNEMKQEENNEFSGKH